MNINEFITKWNIRFATNDTFEIDEQDFREFKDDIAAFLAAGPGGTATLSELNLPQPVIADSLYLTGTAIWAARSSFNAVAPPMPGPNWRLVADFRPTITAASITDASPAGRSLLTAASASVQLGLLDQLSITKDQYGTHPAFGRAYEANGLLLFLLKSLMQLQQLVQSTQTPSAPPAPTNGEVEDTADTFSGTLVPGFLAVADYEVFGAPGFPGTVNAAAAGGDVQNGRIYSRGLTGNLLAGGAGIRVAASGNRPAGAWLLSDKPFTGSVAVTPAPSPALTAALAISVASLTLGAAVSFSITPGGGTAPYTYEVVATDTATGQQFTLGTTKSGSWTPSAGGSYGIEASVSDSSSPAKVAQSATRYLQVVQAANRIPVADAGSDLAFQLPTKSAALMGRAIDPDGDAITGHAWRQVTGPSSVTGLPSSTQNVVVSNLVEGVYQFGYRATDSRGGQSDEDFVMVTVQAAATQLIELVAFGDSRTAAASRKGYDGNWWEQIQSQSPLSGSTYVGRANYAVGGGYTVAHSADPNASYIAAQLTEAAGTYRSDVIARWAAVFIGINDIQNRDSQADVRTNFTTAINQVKQAGATKILAATLITSNYTGFDAARLADIYSDVLAFNTWLRNSYATIGVDVLVDVASDKYFGGSDAATNQTYFFADQIHLRPAGSLRIANIAAKGYSLLAQGKTGVVVSDELYTPPTGGTPTPTQPPGTSAPTLVEDFERSDGAVGNGWANPDFFKLVGGKAVSQDSFPGGRAPMVRPQGEKGNRQRATATFAWGNTGLTPGLVCRSDGGGNYYMAYFTDKGSEVNINIFRISNYSGVTPLATTVVTGIASNRLYRISFVCYDDQLVASVLDTDGSAVAAVRAVDSVYSTGTCGLTADSVGVEILDFQVATV